MNEVLNYILSSNIDTFKAKDEDTIYKWANRYYHLFVVNSSFHTGRAKKSDLDKFLSYFSKILHSNNTDLWTPSITRGFQNYLSEQRSHKTNAHYVATTINRILATIRHFGIWLHKERPLLAGNPFTGVRMTQIEEPSWNGLTPIEIIRLKAACDTRLNACKKNNQNPLLEVVVFYMLLSTGLRESELAQLNYGQYHARGLLNVKRKGNKITKKIPLPTEARDLLDKYLILRTSQKDESKEISHQEPLIISRYGSRILTRDIARICDRIAAQASAQLSQEQKIKLSPHMLRHTFLKRVADKHGVHTAQDLSGNISMREIFRYTKPNYQQKHDIVESLF